MLRSTSLELWSPKNMARQGDANQVVQDGWLREWYGGGTLKELTTRQSTRETGSGQVRMAVARSRAIPRSMTIKPLDGDGTARLTANSWRLKGPDGAWWEILNVTRTGDLTTLSLQEAEA